VPAEAPAPARRPLSVQNLGPETTIPPPPGTFNRTVERGRVR